MGDLLSVDDYRQMTLATVRRLPVRTVPLIEALNRICAYDIHTNVAVPAFASAAMDGFAVLARDLEASQKSSGVTLEIQTEMSWGAGQTLKSGSAAPISTGARLPPGADAVVPIERCRVEGGRVTIPANVRPGENVRPAGNELAKGDLLLAAGTRIDATRLSLLAMVGTASVRVVAEPVIGVLSTGSELVRPGEALGGNQIYDANFYLMSALLVESGAQPVNLGIVPDDPGALIDRLEEAAPGVDALLSTGGTSVGRTDPVRLAAESGKVDLRCHSVNVKPGRPQALGRMAGKPYYALPGNPVAALVSFYVFVRPAVSKLGGAGATDWVHAPVGGSFEADPRRECFRPARLCPKSGTWVPVESMNARSTTWAMAQADGLVRVMPTESLSPGDLALVLPKTP